MLNEFARMSLDATHTQPLQGGAPTGKRFTLRTIDIWRVENGKFAEHWDIVDFPGLLRQLTEAQRVVQAPAGQQRAVFEALNRSSDQAHLRISAAAASTDFRMF